MAKRKILRKKTRQRILRGKIVKWIKEAQNKLLLQAWDVNVDFGYGEKRGYMRTTSTPKYLSAVIEIKLKACSKVPDKQIRRDCYHEMLHALLSEFADLAMSRHATEKQLVLAEEKVVEVLAKIIVS